MEKNRNGFTLMEILIVASIITVLSGTSLAILSTLKNDRELGSQANLFVNLLELAKSKAAAGDTSMCSHSESAYIDGYTVQASASAILLVPGCDTVPTPQIFRIPSGITYDPSVFSIRFDEQNYQGSTERYILKNKVDDARCKFVQIDETGLITNGDILCP